MSHLEDGNQFGRNDLTFECSFGYFTFRAAVFHIFTVSKALNNCSFISCLYVSKERFDSGDQR